MKFHKLTLLVQAQSAGRASHRSEAIASKLQTLISKYLGTHVLQHVLLADIGLDLLGAAFLQTHLRSLYGISIKQPALLGGLSIDSLAHNVAIWAQLDAHAVPQATSQDYDSIVQRLTTVLEGKNAFRACRVLKPFLNFFKRGVLQLKPAVTSFKSTTDDLLVYLWM